MNQPAKQPTRPKRKPEPVYLKVIKGGLVPADGYAESQLRAKKFRIGDVIKAYLESPLTLKRGAAAVDKLRIDLRKSWKNEKK